MKLDNAQMEQTIRSYFDACNSGDAEQVKAFFTEDAVHYFPAGSPFGALRGAQAIGDCWAHCVAEMGSWWTVDHFIGDENKQEAVIEWTHFKPNLSGYLRGDEWYYFNEQGLITEIRAYYAAPASKNIHEIGEYDYPLMNYPLELPVEAVQAGRVVKK